MASGRLAKDVQYLRRHIAAQTKGQAKITEVDDNQKYLKLEILPEDGYYRGAKLRFQFNFNEWYPDVGPQVLCLDEVYHPNIEPLESFDSEDMDSCSNVCVSLLSEWESEMGLDHIVMALLFILYHPAPDDALSPYFDSPMTMEEIEDNIRKTLRGETLDGKHWPCLMVEDEEQQHDEMKPKEDESVSTAVKQASENYGPPITCTNEKVTTEKSISAVDSSEDVAIEESASAVNRTETVLSESGAAINRSEDSDIQDLPATSVEPLTQETMMLNLHNSALVDRTSQALKQNPLPVICLDSADCDNRNLDTTVDCGYRQGIWRLFSRIGLSRIKILFSNFQRGDGTLQFQATCRALEDSGDCDVD